MKKEEHLQMQVCQWLKLQYPDIIFYSDASGTHITVGQAKKAKKMRSGRGMPDLFIAEPAGSYPGLFIELKATEIFKKDGNLKKSIHLSEQRMMLNRLLNKGYMATFSVGFEQTKEIIEKYLNNLF